MAMQARTVSAVNRLKLLEKFMAIVGSEDCEDLSRFGGDLIIGSTLTPLFYTLTQWARYSTLDQSSVFCVELLFCVAG